MDRRWKIPALLSLLLSLGATGRGDVPIREAKWLLPEARFVGLSTQPSSCVKMPQSAEEIQAYRVGSTAFRTPLLLGGQAARAGLSCASCHASGRATTGFQFPGLSGASGTADVTSSIMSRVRGDAVFNPKRIPDLAVDPPKISRDPASSALDAFIRDLIVEEFDGPEPAPAVLGGLATYVRALDAQACDKDGRVPVTLNGDLADLRTALEQAKAQTAKGDGDTAWMMIAGGRTILGDMYSRFAGPALDPQRLEIKAMDAALRGIQSALRRGEMRRFRYEDSINELNEVSQRLSAGEAKSLYNLRKLAAALRR